MSDKTHRGVQAMERVEKKFKFHHFSHEHPLEHTNSPPKHNKICAGCKLMIVSGKDSYCCTTCPFSLHQVCYNMPRKTRHPAHPSYYLNLHHSPPNAKGTISCQACGNPVAGFYYDCTECGLYYHSLCSTLPFSIATSSHPHALKLSFSPPFDLCCDICNEPGYDGWLYRCHICEFDTHLFCAISNQTVVEPPQNPIPPVLLPNNTFSRHRSKHSSAISSLGINVAENYNNESNELLQLVRQKVFRGKIKSNIGEEKAASPVTGWDERLYSPKQNFNVRISHIGQGGSHQTHADHMTITSSNPKQHLVPKDPQTPVSEDMTMTQSYQFSDAYFSIDLAKSYSPYGVKIQGRKESSDQGPAPEVQGRFGNRDTITPSKVLSNPKHGKQPSFVNEPGINYSNKTGPENKLSEAFLTRGDTPTRKELGQKDKKIKASQTMVRSVVGNQSTKSDTERSSPSFWQNLCTCCNPGYERSAKGKLLKTSISYLKSLEIKH